MDAHDLTRARTELALSVSRHVRQTLLVRAVPLPIVYWGLRPMVHGPVLEVWLLYVIVDFIRSYLRCTHQIRVLQQSPASEQWERRAAPLWGLTGLSVAILPIAAHTSGTYDAQVIAMAIVMGATAISVVVTQVFTLLAVAVAAPGIVTTIVCWLAPPHPHPLLALVVTLFGLTLAQVHRTTRAALLDNAQLRTRNDRLKNELTQDRDRLAQSEAALQKAVVRLQHDAHHDPLTGLGNRALLSQAHLEISADQQVGILYADLDQFKEINDTRGHEAGDELLVHVAQRIRQFVRSTDAVARVGGDEFVIVLTQGASQQHAAILAQRLATAIEAPFHLTDGPATVGVTIGVAWSNGHTDVHALLRQADQTMYAGKRRNRGTITDSEGGDQRSRAVTSTGP